MSQALSNVFKLHDVINVKDPAFGAKGDGVADDRSAIQAAIDAAELAAPATVYLPRGTYNVSGTISIDSDNVGIVGSGPYQTIIRGTFASGDIIYVDGSIASVENFYASNFRVTSSVLKSSGAGIHLRRATRLTLSGIIADGQDGNGNLWHGLHFDGVDFCRLVDFEARGQQDGIRINGGNGSIRSDCYMSMGKIASCAIGLHVTGDFGGLYADAVAIINNGVNVDIDQDDVAAKNREIFFGGGCLIDSSSVGANVVIDDANLGEVFFNNTWNATAKTHGLHIINSGAGGFVQLTGGTVWNNVNDGIRIDDADCKVIIGGGTKIRGNGGWGINATVITNNVIVLPCRLENNSSGNIKLNKSNSSAATGYILQPSVVRVVLNGNQTVTTGSSQDLQLAAATFDALTEWDTTNFRYNPKVAGLYQISAQAHFTVSVDQSFMEIAILKNTSKVARQVINSSGTGQVTLRVTDIVSLNDTDTVKIQVQQNTGSDKTVDSNSLLTFCTARRVY